MVPPLQNPLRSRLWPANLPRNATRPNRSSPNRISRHSLQHRSPTAPRILPNLVISAHGVSTITHPNPQLCPFCNYDMSGASSGTCPECGRPINRFTARARDVMTEANKQAVSILITGDSLLAPLPWWKPRFLFQPITSASDLLVDTSTPHAEISPRHILLAILEESHCVGYQAICNCGVAPARLRETILKLLPRCAPVKLPSDAKLPPSERSRRIIKEAIEEAHRLNHNWVGTEHLLLALTRITGYECVVETLYKVGVDEHPVRAFIIANMDARNNSTIE